MSGELTKDNNQRAEASEKCNSSTIKVKSGEVCSYVSTGSKEINKATNSMSLSKTISDSEANSSSDHGSNSQNNSVGSLATVVEFGVSSVQGYRKTMEDRHTTISKDGEKLESNEDKSETGTGDQNNLANSSDDEDSNDPRFSKIEEISKDKIKKDIPFFAVFDGHAGYKCAEYLKIKLHQFVLSQDNLTKEPEKALKKAILEAEEEFTRIFDEENSGSTLACVLIIGNYIYTANVGDTEIVLSRGGEPQVLSERHNPKTNKEEEKRVIAAGGRIYKERVGHPQFNPAIMSLAISRAIGDIAYKKAEYTEGKNSGIIPDPYTKKTKVDKEKDEFIIIGCDGLWDVMNYKEAVDFCHNEYQKLKEINKENFDEKAATEKIAKDLVKLAIEKNTTDNVTVLLISFDLLKKNVKKD